MWSDLPAVAEGSRVVLGGRFGEEPEQLTHQRLDRFAADGGRLVDTAHSYADGEAERVLGRWMRTRGRDRIAVIDKICHPHNGQLDLRPAAIRAQLDESLRRLDTDHLDVVLLHRDDPAVPVDDITAALVAEVEAGRARCLGVSNWSLPRLHRFVGLARSAGHTPIVSYQRSLAVPEHEIWPGALTITDPVTAELANARVPLLAWAGQARGWFSRTPTGDWAINAGPFASARNRRLRDLAIEIGRGYGVPATVVALAWLLHHEEVWPIVGPATDVELAESLRATSLTLTEAELSVLDLTRAAGAGTGTPTVRPSRSDGRRVQ